jgi:hypothetical protein
VLAEIFLDHIDDFVELANRYPDPAARSSAPSSGPSHQNSFTNKGLHRGIVNF